MIGLTAWLAIGLSAAGAMLDPSGDVVIHRVPVPSADKPQAEVRIVRRAGRPVVQTLLDTRVLKRVIHAIIEKERRSWPERAAGHAESEKYLAALERFERSALARRDAATTGDRRVQGLIEFVDAKEGPFVAIGGARIETDPSGMRLVDREEPALLHLSPEYVRRNMRLIVADSFHVTDREADNRLGRAGPT